ncbi:MAG TPA: hypothetical protein VID29_10665 [Solirubrobacteraceae bacterium]|jgi:peptidoglycan/LPS O-acetylase OafA/YrhL
MRLRRLRLGEMLALLGALLVIVALTRPWYETPQGSVDAWATFGPTIVLLMLAAAGGLALALATVTERSTALPVAAAVWGTLLGFAAVVAALVRLLERPDHASALCAGAWLALAGALAILAGSWQSMRDERTELYEPSDAKPRPPPAT